MANTVANSSTERVPYTPVVIVGAGESGIAMGCRLKEKLGHSDFRIIDRQGGIGGTWYINTYPFVTPFELHRSASRVKHFITSFP
jgi:cation diffusion facilitator CzcD-associated flavoprotein CzcO